MLYLLTTLPFKKTFSHMKQGNFYID